MIREALTNQSLYNLKLELINSINHLSLKPEFSFSCTYHGVPLIIHTDSSHLINQLKVDLPQSWQKEEDHACEIFLIDPRDKNIELESWCDESSQDCFYTDEGRIAIQRDFVSKEISKNIVVLITEASLTDGPYNFLRWFLPRKLIELKSYILHSSIIIGNDNKARVFLGHSGAGKTTISSFSGERKILGDDMNLVHYQKEKLFAKAGAIGGFFKSSVDYDCSFEVKAFYWLKQTTENQLELLTPATSLSKLMASYANLFWESLAKKETESLFELSTKIINTYPMYQLSFKKDISFWELLDES